MVSTPPLGMGSRQDSKASFGAQVGPVQRYKLIQLEAIRGIASVIVIFHHFSLAFSPTLKSQVASTPIAILFNGEGAVTLFFVLSGFVLTRRYFDNGGGRIGMAAMKRWPRLLLPSTASIMLGCAALLVLPAWFAEAGVAVNSDWLIDFGGSGRAVDFQPSFVDALIRSFGVFLFPSGYIQYNSSLWTMFPELFGSLFCFAYAAFATKVNKRWTGGVLLLLALVAWRSSSSWLLPFALGVATAQYLPFQRISLSLWKGLVLIAVGLALWISYRYLISAIGSMLIIATVLTCPAIAEALSGKVGKTLGRLSFPLYLVHVIVICTAGSLAFLLTNSIAVAALVTGVVSVIVAIPFAALDEAWVAYLRRFTGAGKDIHAQGQNKASS